jgi:hypothetical protein
MKKIEKFFKRYEEGANTFDPELVTAFFTPVFMGASPNDVACGENDAGFHDAIVARKGLFEQIGFKFARVLSLEATPLDDRYTMAKVRWHMLFERESGKPMDFRFYITYFLFDDGAGPKVCFYISHEDERQVMQEAGLIPRDPDEDVSHD